jgi:hypothetical protein
MILIWPGARRGKIETSARIRHTAIPWLNSNIKKMMCNRDYHKKQSVKYGSEYHWKLIKSHARNRVNIEIRKSKSRYILLPKNWRMK